MAIVLFPNGTTLVDPTLDELLKAAEEAGYRKFRLLEMGHPMTASEFSKAGGVLLLDPIDVMA